MKPILVVAALIQNPQKSKILIARRKHDASLEAGKWEFPGGKVEPLEHPEQTLVREIREELALEVQVDRIFDVASHVYQTPSDPVHIILLCYLCSAKTETFQLLDVSDAKWVTPTELPNFDYAAADIATVAKLKSYLQN